MQANHIQATSGFSPQTIPLIELYQKYVSKEIQTYAVWLQRLKQESKWSKNDWFKARSYLYRLFSSGKESKSTFTVVKIELLIARLQDTVEFLSPEEVKGNIFKMMIDDLEKLRQDGCKLILLDGQNRLEYAIKKFFENELQFYLSHKMNKKPKSINFCIQEKFYTPQSFSYKDLTSEQKNLIDDIQVIFAVGNEGEIDEFIEDLIDDNSGESWNDFERAITSLRTITYLVNLSLSKGEGNVPEFAQVFKRVGKLSGDYHYEKKGFNKILCELIQYDYNGNLKLDYEIILDETKRDKITKSYENVKEFFKLLAKDGTFNWSKGTTNVFHSKEMLRNFFMIIKILNSGAVGYTVPMDKIFLVNELYKDFERFDLFKRDRVKNKKEYMKVSEGVVPTPNTWIWAQKDIRPEVLELRKTILVTFISENIDKWIAKNVIKRLDRGEVTESIKRKVVLDSNEDIYSGFGQSLNKYVDDVSVDHLEQFGRGGSNGPENLGSTTAYSNSARVK
mgnify:FL=1|jgi:hypothetical protein|tara:strand:+ start:190 stop:1707 length:1518 start_codon:yes stop_codon:yes gene_type:complete